MEQTGKKTFFGAFRGQAFGESNFLRSQSGAETVCPEVFEGFSRETVVIVKCEGLEAERKCLENFHARELNGFGRCDDGAARAEMRRVDDMKEFGAEARILFDDGGNFAHVDIRCGEQFAETKICFGRSGQGPGAANHFADPIVANEVAVLADAAEECGERFKVEGLAEEAMADGEAFGDFQAIGKPGNDDASGLRIIADDFAEESHAVHARHGEVGNDDVEGFFVEKFKCFFAAGGGVNLVTAPQGIAQAGVHLADNRFIINE